jgi:hypothetical protein
LTEKFGIPIGVAMDGANRNDSILLAPTLDDAARLGLLKDIETLWIDRGYDSKATVDRLVEREINDAIIAKKRKKGEAKGKNTQPMGMRWPVERTNSWLSNVGQLRRNGAPRVGFNISPTSVPVIGQPSTQLSSSATASSSFWR